MKILLSLILFINVAAATDYNEYEADETGHLIQAIPLIAGILDAHPAILHPLLKRSTSVLAPTFQYSSPLDLALRLRNLSAVNVMLQILCDIECFVHFPNLQRDDVIQTLQLAARLGDLSNIHKFISSYRTAGFDTHNSSSSNDLIGNEIPFWLPQADGSKSDRQTKTLSLNYYFQKNISDHLRPPLSMAPLAYTSAQASHLSFYGGESSQLRYNQEFNRAVETAVVLMKEYPLSFKYVMKELAFNRQIMAFKLGHQNAHLFGTKRITNDDQLSTPIVSSPIYEKYMDLLFLYPLHSIELFLDGHIENKDDGDLVQGTVVAKIGDQMIELTSIKDGRFYHTDPKNLPLIWSQLSTLFNEVLCTQFSLDDPQEIRRLDNQVSDIIWWLSQGTLYNRGSAAITDMLRHAIYRYHHCDGGKWKEGVMSDCYALISPTLEIFKEWFFTIKEPTTKMQ